MKKVKRFLSLLLTMVMVLPLLTSTGAITLAASESDVAPMSLLPLEEVTAYLILTHYSEDEIKAMPVSTVINSLKDKEGNTIEIDPDASVVWTRVKDEMGNVIIDEYHVIDRNETVDLSYFEGTTEYTLELIVGSGHQLDSNNIRYIVKVYFGYENRVAINLYLQEQDSTRTKIEPLKRLITNGTYDKIIDVNGNPVQLVNFAYTVDEATYLSCLLGGVYVGLDASITERPDVELEIYELADNRLQNPITDKVLNADLSDPNYGYQMPFLAGGASFIIVYYIDGIQMDLAVVSLVLTTGYIHIAGSLSDDTTDEIVYKTNESVDMNNDIYTLEYVLNRGLLENDEYYYHLEAENTSKSINDKIIKIVQGHFDSLEEASFQEDIKESLLSESGYKADFSGDGLKFTVFFEDGTISGSNTYKIIVKTSAFIETMPDFDDAPVIGAKDPYFRVDGVKVGNELLDTYIVENGKAINLDTLYGYGYQTIFINNKNVDMTQLKPTFWFGDADRVETYAVSKAEGSRQTSGESIRDFSKGTLQYGTIIDTNEKNYQVTFVKKETGPKLYVNGPSERTIFLDEYFEYKHDILIANVGDQPLTGLKVELDATNVKLDDYWTVGGIGNDTLAAFTTTSTSTQYGELANIAKIRLLPDGEGEIEGTLTITADDQEPVVINLSGRAKNPSIVTEVLDDAVKYVPYSYLIATDNMNDWNKVTFSIESGELPVGIKLFPTTGEIYGVAQEAGEFHIRVKASYSRDDYFEPSYVDLTLVVKDSTNDNVFCASDEGYDILDAIGEDNNGDYNFVLRELSDQELHSNGAFADFVDLWLNGERLVKGVDYYVSDGSTRITIRSQTFEDKANQDGSNTIAAEFRTDGGDPNGTHEGELKRTAQNFTLDIENEIDNVIALIDAIPPTVTLNDKATVEKARAAYDLLSSTQKQAVTNYNKLQAAEATIAKLEENERRDRETANKVITMIDAIPSPVTLGSKDAIHAARSAYNMLTSAQKKYVTNYSRLTAAETALEQLEAAENERAKVDEVIALINSIPESLSLNDKATVEAARKAYDKLTDKQKQMVDNYDVLIAAESTIAELENGKDQSRRLVTFVGRVVDKSGNPMAKFIVELHSTVQTAKTDSNGYFRFNNVEMGTHSVTVMDAEGNVIASKNFSIVEGSPLKLTGNTITAENGTVFTMTIQAEQGELTFLSLQDGDHTTSGSDNPDIGVTPPPTGDMINLPWYILLILSLSGFLILSFYYRKRNHI